MQKTVIEPNGKYLQYWKDVWRYRGLAFNFAKRDITVRYKQTIIGLGWSVISPVINMFILSFVFGTVAKLDSDEGVPYQIMVYAGTIPWTLFSKTLSSTSATFFANSALMKKVYFPRIINPIGTAFSSCVDSLISMCILFLLMIPYHYMPGVKILLFPFFMFLSLLLGFSIGLFLSPYNIKFRDLNQIIPFVLQIGHYITPVAYSFNVVTNGMSPWLKLIYSLNPAAGVVNAFRWCVVADNEFHWLSFISSLIFIAVFLPLGIMKFRKGERTFVDLV